jgi:hypothetical protein
VSRRLIGCLALIGLVYLALGLFALRLATEPGSQAACRGPLRWQDRTYIRLGTPAPSPEIEGVETPVAIGSTLIGLNAHRVYGPPEALASGEPRPLPSRLALECGDGTFQGYEAR